MDKKKIYTVGYTLFQRENTIDVERLFKTLSSCGVNYLVDVRSIPFSRQYPQCNPDNMKAAGRSFGIHYVNMPEVGARVDSRQEVFSKASDIFFETGVFPIAKSNRPEKTELRASDEIVDFRKFRRDEFFMSGLKRIEYACDKAHTLCLMCGEKNPMDCHRYFLISRALENKYGDWLEVRHIVELSDGGIGSVSNADLDKQLESLVRMQKHLLSPMFEDEILFNYYGDTKQEKINDFCDRYWNLLHGWKNLDDRNNNDMIDYD